MNINNLYTSLKKNVLNELFFQIIIIYKKLIIVDLVLILLHIFVGSFGYNLFVLFFPWTLLLLGCIIVKIFNKLKNRSNVIINEIENDIKLHVLTENSPLRFHNFNVNVNYFFKKLEPGFTPFISALVCPFRLFLLGNVMCGSYYVGLIISTKFVIFFTVSLFSELIFYMIFVVTEYELLFVKIQEFLEGIRSIFMLKNHEDAYLNTFNSNITLSFFLKKFLKYFIMFGHIYCLLYFTFDIINDIESNSRFVHQSNINENYFVTFLLLSFYLIDTAKTIKSIASFITNYHFVSKMRQLEHQKSTEFSSNSVSNNFGHLDLELKGVTESEINNRNSIKIYEGVEKLSTDDSYMNIKFSRNNHFEDHIESNNFKTCISEHTSKSTTISECQDLEISIKTIANNLPVSVPSPFPKKNAIIEINNTFVFNCIASKSNKINYCDKFVLNGIISWFNLYKQKIGNFNRKYLNNNNDIALRSRKYIGSRHMRNVNISIYENDVLIIFGPNNCGKTLLTKYLSDFPYVSTQKYISSMKSVHGNPKIYLLNEKMLNLVYDVFEYDKFKHLIDPFEFILSGRPFEKEVFDLIFKLLSFNEYYRYEVSNEDGVIQMQNKQFKNKIRLYPTIESQQKCNEAKVCLQLFQFLYSILINHEAARNSIVIIDDILDLLLPSISIKIIYNIISEDSLSTFYNLSFVVTINEELEPFISQLLPTVNSRLRLILFDGFGTSMVYNKHNRISEGNNCLTNFIPSMDFDLNDPFSAKGKNTPIYPFEDTALSSIEVNVQQIKNKKHINRKHGFFVLVMGVLLFFIKLHVFSESSLNRLENYSNLYFFSILLFTPSINLTNSEKSQNINDLSNIIFGFFVVSSFLFERNSLFSDNKLVKNPKNLNDISEFVKLTPDIHYNSTYFLEFKGNQILKNSSLFYRETYHNEEIVIPGIHSKGFRDAIVASKLVKKKISPVYDLKMNISVNKSVWKLPKLTQKHIIFDFTRVLIIFYTLDIITEIVLNILVSSIGSKCCFSGVKNSILSLFSLVESAKDPISTINSIYLRRNVFSHQLFNELFITKDLILEHYFSLLKSINLLFLVSLTDICSRNIFPKICIAISIVIMFSIIYLFMGYFIENTHNPYDYSLGMYCDSPDLFHYLKMNGITGWYRSLLVISINRKYELLKLRDIYIIKIYLYFMSSIILISWVTIMIFSSDYKALNLNSSLLICLLLLFSRPVLTYILSKNSNINGSITDISNIYRKVRKYFEQTNYSLIKVNLSSLSPSTVRTSNSHSSKKSYSRNIEIEFSSPSVRKLQESNLNSEYKEIAKTRRNEINLFTASPIAYIENSYSYGSGCSPLFPFRHFFNKRNNIFKKIGIISNYNLVPLDWKVKMIIDPKKLYSNETIYETLTLFGFAPKYCENKNIGNILNITLIEYYDLVTKSIEINNESHSEHELEKNELLIDHKEFSEVYNEKNIFGNSDNYNLFVSNNYSNIQKALLTVHFVLYRQHYQTLVIHVNYNMYLESWFLLVKECIINHRDSSIENVIFINSQDQLLNNFC